jgi:hypothetical protein
MARAHLRALRHKRLYGGVRDVWHVSRTFPQHSAGRVARDWIGPERSRLKGRGPSREVFQATPDRPIALAQAHHGDVPSISGITQNPRAG